MSENTRLRIHTQLAPEDQAPAQATKHTGRRRAARAGRPRARLTFSDRLMRNSAVACALLLGILALGNVRQPWAEKAADSVRRALSMHIDLDDSIGELRFVRGLMPESALVFLNVSGRDALALPAEGAIPHAWSSLQPWMMFESGVRPVYAADAGIVTAVSPLSGNRYGLLIDHSEGLESVYANLDEVSVQSGDAVSRGQRLGTSSNGLYFELRQDGESVDPTERLGL